MSMMIHAQEKDGTKRARIVTLDELQRCETPPQLGPHHKPVPHHELVTSLLDGLDDFGFEVTKQELAVGMKRKAKDGNVYPDTTVFGALEVRGREDTSLSVESDEYIRAIGFRSNNVQAMAIRIVAGGRVFVCDNLMLTGDMPLCNKQHTTNLDLGWEISEALEGIVHQGKRFDDQIERMSEIGLRDRDVERTLCRMFAEKVLPVRHFHDVHSNYFSPEEEWTDCRPRTAWGFNNAVTRALKSVPLNKQMDTTSGVTRFFAQQYDLN